MAVSPGGKVAAIRARLLHLLDELPEGTALPSERELAADWQVARMTLRRAIDTLIDDGLVIRRHGSGTYAARPRLARQLTMTSFSEEMRRQGLTPSSRTLEFRRMRAGDRVGAQLRIPTSDDVVRFVRLRLADDRPMAVETTHIPAASVPGLSAADLAGSWYDLLDARYGIRLVTGTSVIEPALAEPDNAERLEIAPNQPCFLVHTVSRDARGHVVEIGTSLYRGDRYTLTAERTLGLAPAPMGRRPPASTQPKNLPPASTA